MKVNFIGLAFTLVAMQAEIGTLFVTTVAKSGIEHYSSIAAMTQVRRGRCFLWLQLRQLWYGQ